MSHAPRAVQACPRHQIGWDADDIIPVIPRRQQAQQQFSGFAVNPRHAFVNGGKEFTVVLQGRQKIFQIIHAEDIRHFDFRPESFPDSEGKVVGQGNDQGFIPVGLFIAEILHGLAFGA